MEYIPNSLLEFLHFSYLSSLIDGYPLLYLQCNL